MNKTLRRSCNLVPIENNCITYHHFRCRRCEIFAPKTCSSDQRNQLAQLPSRFRSQIPSFVLSRLLFTLMAEYRSTLQEGTREDVVSSSASPFFVQSPSNRAKVNVGTSSSVPLFDDTDSPASGDTVPGQLDGVVSNFDINRHPLSLPAFLLGLKWAGYLEPLDTSRNKIKQRYNHFLDKEQVSLTSFGCFSLVSAWSMFEKTAS